MTGVHAASRRVTARAIGQIQLSQKPHSISGHSYPSFPSTVAQPVWQWFMHYKWLQGICICHGYLEASKGSNMTHNECTASSLNYVLYAVTGHQVRPYRCTGLKLICISAGPSIMRHPWLLLCFTAPFKGFHARAAPLEPFAEPPPITVAPQATLGQLYKRDSTICGYFDGIARKSN